jgi:ELWxxDGT repeat protein
VTQNGSSQTLWRSDGTAANTLEITTQPEIAPLIAYHSNLLFKVRFNSTTNQLWKVDASYNASLLKDINYGSLSGYEWGITIANDLVYFFAHDGADVSLWRTDATTAGTVMAIDLEDHGGYTGSYYNLTSVNNVLYFSTDYETGDYGGSTAELWKSNGTAAGTVIVYQNTEDAYSYSYNYFSRFLPFNGKLAFFFNVGDPIYSYLMITDGTTAGTRRLGLVTIDGEPMKIIDADQYFLFYAHSQGFTTPIKKSDGTTITDVHQFSEYHSGDNGVDLTYANGRAFFIDDVDAYSGTEKPRDSQLWQADLASGITQPVQDIYNIQLNGSGNIVASDGSIFFTRLITGQLTLWYYNPSSPPVASACETSGFIEQEKWENVSGYGVSTIPVNTQPSSINVLGNFATQQNSGDNYGSRVRGYICPPETGNYVFYISSDDNSELWLSTDDDPANKKLIASSKWTNYNEWTKYPTQQSAAIPLLKGTKYYIEALHKEATGADHLSVGWKLPNGTLERPIAGVRLTPFKRNTPPHIAFTKPDNGATFTAPATIDMEAFAWDSEGPIAKVGFYSSGTLLGEDSTNPYTYQWTNVPQGSYTIEARATDTEGFVKSDYRTVTVTAPPTCSGTGSIFQEIWVNAAGTDVRTFDYSIPPNGGGRHFNSFETTQYYANNYASRMRGYVCVPQTGNYTLWISSDDYSELYLSTDETEANKKLIAWVYGATPFRNYDKYSSQKSALINLQAGHKYYIEARHKEGTGNDFISVGWQLPDGTMERPIPGNRLIAIEPIPNEAPSITITSPQANQTFSSSSSIRLAADVTDPDGVKQVTFQLRWNNSWTMTIGPFTNPPYEYQASNLTPGSYQFIVSADDNRDAGTSKSIFFTVEESSCTGAGKIFREIWTGIPGTSVSSIPTNSTPNAVQQLSSLATGNYYGNDYGSRIRGYVCVPESGVYTFWISSDDNGELWLSSNDDPGTKQRIAYVTGATSVNQWTKYSTQVSQGINLVQGTRYYIEVLHKEGNGADHVEVGWQLPSGTLERPIPGNRIIPFDDASTTATVFSKEVMISQEQEPIASVYPNPVVSGNQLSITLPEGSAGEVSVDIVSATGVSVQSENLYNEAGQIVMDVKSSISPGIYLIRVNDNRKRWMSKIQIK